MRDTEFKVLFHSRMCDLADLILHQYDPCKIDGNACLAGDPNPCCIRTRFKRRNGDKRCLFIGANGCTFPNIECKVWLCKRALEAADGVCIEALHDLELLARSSGLME